VVVLETALGILLEGKQEEVREMIEYRV